MIKLEQKGAYPGTETIQALSDDGKGSYIILIELPRGQRITVGKLGIIAFPPGFYAYVGSARGGFKARIGYHLRRKENPRWHIDYLLEEAKTH